MYFLHLKKAEQTYFEHLKDSIYFSFISLKASFYFLFHGIYPDIFEYSGSTQIKLLMEKINTKYKN